MKRILTLILALVLCIGLLPLSVLAAESGPTKAEIQQKWQAVDFATTTFSKAPSVSAPYAAGSLTEDFLQSGVTYLNYVRFVAGLPEITDDDTYNLDAQHGAVVLAAIDTLTHYPEKPADMADTFFNRGYSATTSANISARWGFSNATTMLQSAISGCMSDSSSTSNLSTLGHRRWLLNPRLGKVGFGYAVNPDSGWHYIVTKVHDRSGQNIDYDFVSWPAAGNHPTNLFATTDPWSITLNPGKYQIPAASDLTITITRRSDGKQWSFNSKTGSPTTSENPYMLVERSGYGVSNCIIFHPGSKHVDQWMGVHDVVVKGLKTQSGKATELRYSVDFFDVNKPLGKTPFVDVVPGDFYEEPVAWAVEKGITNGLDATHFGPNQSCNRAQVVTFLWRAAGSPKPASTAHPFVDVEKGSFYEKAVCWAVEKGITNGLDATHFGPNQTCNRAQVVTFLWRALNRPGTNSTRNPFADVQAGEFYYEPVLWAVKNGITNGLSANEFGINAICNRAQIVTFLYRAFA